MDYGRGQHKSARALPEEGPGVRLHGREPRDARGDLRALSARAAQVRDSRGALSRAASAGLPHAERDAARRRGDRLHAGGRRGRRVVLHDVLHAAGRPLRAAGVPDALVRADGRRARDRGAVEGARHRAGRDRRGRRVHAARGRVPRRLRSRAGRRRQRPLARVPEPEDAGRSSTGCARGPRPDGCTGVA